MAKDLLVRYGSLPALLTADADSILQEKWMGETNVAALKIVQVAALRLLSEPVRELPILALWQSLLDYLRADMARRLSYWFTAIQVATARPAGRILP